MDWTKGLYGISSAGTTNAISLTRDSHFLYYENNAGGGKPNGIGLSFNLYNAPDRYKNGANIFLSRFEGWSIPNGF